MAGGPRHWKEGPCAVYRQYDAAGALLYIGCSRSPQARHAQLTCSAAPWARSVASIRVEWHPNRATALEAEAAAITAEKPPHNIQHNPDVPNSKGRVRSGHLFLAAWMKRSGTSVDGLARQIGRPVAATQKIIDGTLIPQGDKSCERIALACEGFVPLASWQRPAERFAFYEVSAAEAAYRVEFVKAQQAWREDPRPWNKRGPMPQYDYREPLPSEAA